MHAGLFLKSYTLQDVSDFFIWQIKKKIQLQISINYLHLWRKWDISTPMMDQETYDITEVGKGPEVGNYYNICPCTAFCGLSCPVWMLCVCLIQYRTCDGCLCRTVTHPISVLWCSSCWRNDTNGCPAANEEWHCIGCMCCRLYQIMRIQCRCSM